MDINFYSGDIYGSDDSWLLVAIAVGSVIGAIIAQRVYDNYKTNEQLDTLFDYMAYEAGKLGSGAVQQADAFTKVSRLLKAKGFLGFVIPKVSAFNTQQIQEWNTSSFASCIISRRSDSPEKLIGLHSGIKAAFSQAMEMEKMIYVEVEKLNARTDRFQQQWKAHVQSISYYLDQFNMNHVANPMLNDIFLIQFNHLVGEWKLQPGETRTQMHIVYDMLVEPLIALCKQHPMDNRAFYFIRELHELKAPYEDLEYTKKMYRRWFLDLARKLVKLKIELKNGFSEIQKIKKKSRWHF
ncbi:MAG: hypothetical protein JWO06_3123 [Bacteroidota bacterium]|nr:hypothetical protein [Bacteroidota bacterium]